MISQGNYASKGKTTYHTTQLFAILMSTNWNYAMELWALCSKQTPGKKMKFNTLINNPLSPKGMLTILY